MNGDGRYLLDNQRSEAGRRFDALAELFDPSTFRHLAALGISPGWRVWEVGAGGPSVARWLADQVGREGSVLASDIDTAWLERDEQRRYEVRRHDVGTDPKPEGLFDLVHSRLVLVHVAERDRAIESMVSALAPGGWLVLEEADPGLQELACPDECGDAERLANQIRRAFRSLMAERDVDLALGRTLPRRLGEAGLTAVGSEAFFPMAGARTLNWNARPSN